MQRKRMSVSEDSPRRGSLESEEGQLKVECHICICFSKAPCIDPQRHCCTEEDQTPLMSQMDCALWALSTPVRNRDGPFTLKVC